MHLNKDIIYIYIYIYIYRTNPSEWREWHGLNFKIRSFQKWFTKIGKNEINEIGQTCLEFLRVIVGCLST